MRFSTRDLLLLTTIVAGYAAMAAVLLGREALDLGFDLPYLIMLVFSGSVVWPVIRARQSLGRDAVRFRRSRAALPHLGILLAAAVFAWFHRGPEDAFPLWLYFPILAATHICAEFAASVFVGEPGVLAGAKLLKWGDYEFSIRKERIECVPIRYSSERKTERYALISEDAKELGELLVARQSLAEGQGSREKDATAH